MRMRMRMRMRMGMRMKMRMKMRMRMKMKMRMIIIIKIFFSKQNIKMSYYLFNRQEILEKAKKDIQKKKLLNIIYKIKKS